MIFKVFQNVNVTYIFIIKPHHDNPDSIGRNSMISLFSKTFSKKYKTFKLK